MELEEFTDEQLVAMFRHGRSDAFDVLFRRHEDRIFRIGVRMTGSAADAEEALQETFLRLARHAESFRPRARFSTWLYRVAVNRCLSLRERMGRGKLVLLPGLERLEAGGHPGLASGEPGPYERARADEVDRSLTRRVAELPDPLCAAFTLRVLEERPYAEVAEILEVPEGTAKTHVHRARLLLRRRLAPELEPLAVNERGRR